MKFEDDKQKAFSKLASHFLEVMKNADDYDFVALLTGHKEGVTYGVSSVDPVMTLLINLKATLEGIEELGLIKPATSSRLIALVLCDALKTVDGNTSTLPTFVSELIDEGNIRGEVNKTLVMSELEHFFDSYFNNEIDLSEFSRVSEALKDTFNKSIGGGSND